jgi:hypothetical protein
MNRMPPDKAEKSPPVGATIKREDGRMDSSLGTLVESWITLYGEDVATSGPRNAERATVVDCRVADCHVAKTTSIKPRNSSTNSAVGTWCEQLKENELRQFAKQAKGTSSSKSLDAALRQANDLLGEFSHHPPLPTQLPSSIPRPNGEPPVFSVTDCRVNHLDEVCHVNPLEGTFISVF